MAQKYKISSDNGTVNSDGNSTPKKSLSASEMRAWWEKYAKTIANFEDSKEALKKLKDVTKSTREKNTTRVTKTNLRTYLENPSSNEAGLRNVSRYLATRCQVYYRLIKYNANMFC